MTSRHCLHCMPVRLKIAGHRVGRLFRWIPRMRVINPVWTQMARVWQRWCAYRNPENSSAASAMVKAGQIRP